MVVFTFSVETAVSRAVLADPAAAPTPVAAFRFAVAAVMSER